MASSNPYNQAGAVVAGGSKSKTYSKKLVKSGAINPYNDFGATSQKDALEEQKQIRAAQSKPVKQTKSQPSDKSVNKKEQKSSTASSIFSKVKKVGKDFADASTAGEQKFAQGIARTLPGGTADLKANEKLAEQNAKNIKQAQSYVKAGKMTPEQAKKLIKSNADEAVSVSKNSSEIVKKMPTKKQIVLGAASTTADIVTAGTFSRGKAGLIAAKELTPVIKGTSLAKKVTRGGSRAAAYGTAGALNAAADDGNKKQIAANFIAGATLPEVLRMVGQAGAKVVDQTVHSKAAQSVLDKIRTPKALIENAKTQSLLQKARETETVKAAEQTKKIDEKVELINAKKADGKFTNVDKVKVKQLEQQKQELGVNLPKTAENGAVKAQPPTAGRVVPETPKPQESIPTHSAYGRKIQMTEENGYKAIKVADGGTVYQKVARAGSNARGTQLTNTWYGADGTKLTQAQADAMVKGDMRSIAPKVTQPTQGAKTSPLTQAIDKNYKGGKNGPEEAKALDYVRTNPEKTLKTYDGIIKEKFGATNVVSGDEAKYSIPGFSSTKSVAYHEPASAVAKVKYQQLLDEPTTKNKPVLLMAGGSGAGKTSALKRLGINYDNYAAVVDTNSNKLESAKAKIEQALASGRHIEVFYVHRDPVKAFKSGVIPRGKVEGRIVPVDTHIETHYGSHDVVHQLAKEYKDNPLVEFTVASNNHGHGKAKAIELDEVPKMSYTREEIKPILQKEVDNAHTQGTISTQEHALYHGRENTMGSGRPNVQTVESPASKAASKQPEPQRTAGSQPKVTEAKAIKSQETKTSKLAQGVEANAIKKGLTEGFEGKTEYTNVNIKQQTNDAIGLLKSDPDKAVRIAMGEEPPPKGLLPESVFITVEKQAARNGDVDLLRRLATESHLTSEASGMGQRIRMLGERDETSPVVAIKKVADARAAAAAKRLGKPVNKAVSDEVKQIRAAKPRVTKETWESFVDSLKC